MHYSAYTVHFNVPQYIKGDVVELNKEQKERVEKARDAIDAICDEFKVNLVPQMMIVQGRIVNHSVGILPEPEESRIIKPEMRKEVKKGIMSDPKGAANGA